MDKAVVALASLALLVSCGAKTGLLIPDASRPRDAGLDTGIDAGMCVPQPLLLQRRGAQLVFVVDRSNSMADTLDGREPMGGELNRWQIAGQTLAEVLGDADPLLEVGAKFYPRFAAMDPETPEEACTVDRGIDLAPGRGNVPAFLSIFASSEPQGGTPTAVGLGEVRDYYERIPAPGVPRFAVLVTDGGPNCNPDTGVPHTECLCTGEPTDCTDSLIFGPYNCIDEARALDVIGSLFVDNQVPVYVIGIDDPTRPDLADVLDRMAVAGGRPRDEPGERRFYSVRRTDDLRVALTTITESIARCVFTLEPRPTFDAAVEVRIGDAVVPQDPTRTEGWDFSDVDRSELTLFGGACERVTASGEEVTARIECPGEG